MPVKLPYRRLSDPIDKEEVEANFKALSSKMSNITNDDFVENALAANRIAPTQLKNTALDEMIVKFRVTAGEITALSTIKQEVDLVSIPATAADESWWVCDISYTCSDVSGIDPDDTTTQPAFNIFHTIMDATPQVGYYTTPGNKIFPIRYNQETVFTQDYDGGANEEIVMGGNGADCFTMSAYGAVAVPPALYDYAVWNTGDWMGVHGTVEEWHAVEVSMTIRRKTQVD